MSFFTPSGNKLAMTVLAAGALALGGTGVAAIADSLPDSPNSLVETESPSPTATETESPEPTPTETETESPEPTPTETETESPESTTTETEDPEQTPTETDDPEGPPASTPVGPDVTGPAAAGLCNAFSHGGLNSTSTPYSLLVQVAGGADGIDDYCATIPAPQDGTDDANGTTDGDTDGDTGEEAVEPQQVEPQRQNAPASNGGAGHQGNSAKHSGGRQG
jgi:hypothetical protein